MTLTDFASYARRGPGTYRAPCPECDSRPKDDALAVTVDDMGVVAYCHRCGFTATEGRESKSATPRPQREHRVTPPPSDWRPLWAAMQALTPGSVAGQYLQDRGFRPQDRDVDVLGAPMCRHYSGHVRLEALGAIREWRGNAP